VSITPNTAIASSAGRSARRVYLPAGLGPDLDLPPRPDHRSALGHGLGVEALDLGPGRAAQFPRRAPGRQREQFALESGALRDLQVRRLLQYHPRLRQGQLTRAQRGQGPGEALRQSQRDIDPRIRRRVRHAQHQRDLRQRGGLRHLAPRRPPRRLGMHESRHRHQLLTLEHRDQPLAPGDLIEGVELRQHDRIEWIRPRQLGHHRGPEHRLQLVPPDDPGGTNASVAHPSLSFEYPSPTRELAILTGNQIALPEHA
jgi:hypothetical protein